MAIGRGRRLGRWPWRTAVALGVPTLVLGACAGGGGGSGGSGGSEKGDAARTFTFGVYGDTPYSPNEARALSGMVDQMNGAGLAFTVMVGDIFGGERCSNQAYTTTVDTFNSFAAPLVYSPGDNEWVDCHPFGQDPVERLNHIRRTMFAAPRSFGKQTLALEQQRPAYPENARWTVGSVLFLTLDVPGSNNNHIADVNREEEGTARGPAERQAMEAEYVARDQADRDWLHQSFEVATRTQAPAVVIVMQADPAFDVPPADRAARRVDGFDKLLAALAGEVRAFAKPVLLIHGDSHRQRFDQPLVDPTTGQPVANLTRAETFGSPDVGWVAVTFDLSLPGLFRADPHLVESFRPS